MRFVTDNTVGKLRRWMNLLGYDVIYDPRSSRELVRDYTIQEEGRIILARCPSLAANPALLGRFVHLRSPVLEAQLIQVIEEFPIDFPRTIFTRCSRCNEILNGPLALESVDAEAVPPRVREWRDEYFQCPRCRQVYWEGTHTGRIREHIRSRLSLPV